MKAYMLIKFINHINKFRKVDKQILFYSLFNLLYKSSQKKIYQVSRIDLRVNRILALKTAKTISKNN